MERVPRGMADFWENEVTDANQTDGENGVLTPLYPLVDESYTPLPRCWSALHKSHRIKLSEHNLHVSVRSPQRPRTQPAFVRTISPIPKQCGLFYFEIGIGSMRKDIVMDIGICCEKNKDEGLPPPDDDLTNRSLLSELGSRMVYNVRNQVPLFLDKDIIGVGVDLIHNCIFCTINGSDMGACRFRRLPDALYPVIGLHHPFDEVFSNFGMQRFKFCQIGGLIEQVQGEVRPALIRYPPNVNEQSELSKQIYVGKMRQTIMELISNGHIKKAMDLTRIVYPTLFHENEKLWLRLKCRELVEAINKSNIELFPFAIHDFSTTVVLAPAILPCEEPNPDRIEQNNQSIERIVTICKELHCKAGQMNMEDKLNQHDNEMLINTLSLLYYENPWSCPYGWQLCPTQRYQDISLLNDAILKLFNGKNGTQPANYTSIAHFTELFQHFPVVTEHL